MINRIVLSICGVVFIVVLLGCNNVQIGNGRENGMAYPALEFGEIVEINFQLLGSHLIDISGVRRSYGMSAIPILGEETPQTFFFQLDDIDRLQEDLFVGFSLNLSDFELTLDGYEDKFFAVTIGRELLEMQVRYPYLSFPAITFAEHYEPNVLHFYAMDPMRLWPSHLGRNSFYVMRGTERLYLGEDIFDINNGLLIQEIDDFMYGEINFQLIESHVVDTSGIREKFDVLEWLDFTFFEQADTFADFVQLAYTEYNLDLLDIAFDDDEYQDKFIVITIGRELSEIRYRLLANNLQTRGVARANVTFAQEHNEGVLQAYFKEMFGDTSL